MILFYLVAFVSIGVTFYAYAQLYESENKLKETKNDKDNG